MLVDIIYIMRIILVPPTIAEILVFSLSPKVGKKFKRIFLSRNFDSHCGSSKIDILWLFFSNILMIMIDVLRPRLCTL